MKINTAEFLKSASKPKDFPQYSYPEFAFFGRSNTGKSSLINMLLGRRSLVKVGSKPGVTKTVNFFLINNRISIADMPGYGYAQLSKNIRGQFIQLIYDYLSSRNNLRLAFLLIDIRRIPDTHEKELVTHLSEKNIPVAIIATKCDKLSRIQRKKNITSIASELEIDSDSVFVTSSKTREGRKEIHGIITDFTGNQMYAGNNDYIS